MQTPRRVHDDDVGVSGARGSERIINDRRGVAARFRLDDFSAGSRSPHAKLLNRRRTKGVARGEYNAASILAQPMRELADGRRLTRAIHAHDENNVRASLLRSRGGPVGRRQSAQSDEELIPQFRFQIRSRVEGVPSELLPHHLQNLMRRPRADVGGEQYIFQFREQRGINLFFARDEVFDLGNDLRTRLRDRLFQPVEQRSFTLLEYGEHSYATAARAEVFILAEED